MTRPITSMLLPIPKHRINRFPGWEMIAAGLEDIGSRRLTPAACAVWIAWPRLSRIGLLDESVLELRPAEPERILYRLLRGEKGNAYSRYNAILRRLVRFEHALDRELSRSLEP